MKRSGFFNKEASLTENSQLVIEHIVQKFLQRLNVNRKRSWIGIIRKNNSNAVKSH